MPLSWDEIGSHSMNFSRTWVGEESEACLGSPMADIESLLIDKEKSEANTSK